MKSFDFLLSVCVLTDGLTVVFLAGFSQFVMGYGGFYVDPPSALLTSPTQHCKQNVFKINFKRKKKISIMQSCCFSLFSYA